MTSPTVPFVNQTFDKFGDSKIQTGLGTYIGTYLLIFFNSERRSRKMVSLPRYPVSNSFLNTFGLSDSYGIISLIVFAMMICPFRRGHDPEMNEALARFWTTIHHVANFLVCVMVGILFIRTFFTLDVWETIWKIFALYLFAVVSRYILYLLDLFSRKMITLSY